MQPVSFAQNIIDIRVHWSTLTGALAEPTNRGVPDESTKFARGIKSTSLAITGSVTDARWASLRTRLLTFSP